MSARARALALCNRKVTFGSESARKCPNAAHEAGLLGGEAPEARKHECMQAVGHTISSFEGDGDHNLINNIPNNIPNINKNPSNLSEAKEGAAAAQTARGDDTSSRLRAETRAVRGILTPEEVRQVRGKSRECIAAELQRWRDSFTVQDAKSACKTRAASYSMGVFCSGGCLDTFAGVRSGFIPLWGTETDEQRGKMFADLTQAPCLGDTFAVDFSEQPRVDVLWSGQPCPDWSSSHQGR